VTNRTGRKEDLVRLREPQSDNQLFQRCLAAVREDPRDVYTTGGTAARRLRAALEVKLASARSAEAAVEGGTELLLTLQEFGDKPIQVFGVEDGGKVVAIYANVDEEVLAGCLLSER